VFAMSKGVIYILTNPSFPDYVKIGYADEIDKRLQQLKRSECIPFSFRVYATYGTAAAKLISGKKYSVAGSRFFKYKGEWLNDIRARIGF